MIVRLRYIQRFRDRHGRKRLYLRRRGCKPVPLPPEDDPSFLDAYSAALASTQPAAKVQRVAPGSLEALARSYYASARFRQLRASTATVYRRIIDNLCRKHGDKPVKLLGPVQVRRLIADKSDTPAAANHVLRTLRGLMAHALEDGLIAADPTIGVKRLKEVGEGAATWTEDDIAAYEAHWPEGSRPRLALALMLYTGQRRSDVVRMGRQHVKKGWMDVRQVKTGAELQIPVHPDLARLIAMEPLGHLTFLMTSRGRPFTSNGFYQRFKEWCAEAGLPPDRSPHGLRKAAARRMAEAGCTAHQIAAVTGHRTLAEVQRYTAAADQARMAQVAVLRMGRRKK